MVPEDRSELPFVNQPRCFSFENEAWIHGERLARRLVHIQQHLARRGAPSGLGFAAGPRAFQQDGAR